MRLPYPHIYAELPRIPILRRWVNKSPADVPFPRIPTLDPGLAAPVVEAGLGECGVVAGQECAFVQFCAGVARVRMSSARADR